MIVDAGGASDPVGMRRATHGHGSDVPRPKSSRRVATGGELFHNNADGVTILSPV